MVVTHRVGSIPTTCRSCNKDLLCCFLSPFLPVSPPCLPYYQFCLLITPARRTPNALRAPFMQDVMAAVARVRAAELARASPRTDVHKGLIRLLQQVETIGLREAYRLLTHRHVNADSTQAVATGAATDATTVAELRNTLARSVAAEKALLHFCGVGFSARCSISGV